MIPDVCLPAELAAPQRAPEKREAARRAIHERPDNAPNWQMRSEFVAAGVPAPDAAVFLTSKLWAQHRTIKVQFLEGSSSLQDQVRHYMEIVYGHTSLTPQFVTTGGEVRIAFRRGAGSWSYIGTDCLLIKDGPTMNFGWIDAASPDEEIRSVVFHEDGHRAGMGHGHKHPDFPCRLDEPVVYADLSGPPNNWTHEQIRHNVIDRYAANQVMASDPDFDSIMTYTIPERWTIGDCAVERNTDLSATDIEWLKRTYPKADEPSQPDRVSIEHYDHATNREKVRMGDVILTAGRAREDFAEVRLLGRFRQEG